MNLAELNPVFESVSRYFGLLAEPMRLRILHILCDGEKSVSEIVVKADASQPTISKHLAQLYTANVLSRRRDGNQIFYAVIDQTMVSLCRTVCLQIAAELDEPASAKRAQRKPYLKAMLANNDAVYNKKAAL
jgi:DNA-binding transcriptional ArsR family regulator